MAWKEIKTNIDSILLECNRHLMNYYPSQNRHKELKTQRSVKTVAKDLRGFQNQ